VPGGENPPPGAIVYYYLKAALKEIIKLEILDSQGNVIKTYSSLKKNEDLEPAEWPDEERISEVLPAQAGLNRFFWNLRYEDPVKVPVDRSQLERRLLGCRAHRRAAAALPPNSVPGCASS
jgi:hypothetical protein